MTFAPTVLALRCTKLKAKESFVFHLSYCRDTITHLTKEREGWMLLTMGFGLKVNGAGARRSTESTVSFTVCLEGAVSAWEGVLQVSMVDDRLMVVEGAGG